MSECKFFFFIIDLYSVPREDNTNLEFRNILQIKK